MVPIVSRLEGRGLIDRQRVDGRSQGLYLSTEGEALHTQVMAVIELRNCADGGPACAIAQTGDGGSACLLAIGEAAIEAE
jgi:DNA-binding MarR family transcriptional regulator